MKRAIVGATLGAWPQRRGCEGPAFARRRLVSATRRRTIARRSCLPPEAGGSAGRTNDSLISVAPEAIDVDPLIVALVFAGGIAVEIPEGGSEDDAWEGAGTAALVALVSTVAFVPWNVARRRLIVPRLRGKREALAKLAFLQKRIILPSHIVVGLASLALGVIHGLLAPASNLLLWGAIATMSVMVVAGAVLRWKWVPGEVRKAALLLHAQQLLLVVLLALLVLGHAGVED